MRDREEAHGEAPTRSHRDEVSGDEQKDSYEEKRPAKMMKSSPSGPPDSFPAGLRILLVDDDPLCLVVLERMLRQCNYEGKERHISGFKLLGTRLLYLSRSSLSG